MDKERTKKSVEGRKAYHESILKFHRKVIDIIGQKKTRDKDEMEILTDAVRSSAKVMELIDRDNKELKDLEL